MFKPVKLSSRQRWTLWLGVGLILLFFLSRLIAIDRFPPFLDETQHIHEGELSARGSPFMFTGEGRLFTIWWYMLFTPYRAAPIWMARVATLLAVLPGFAAVVAIGKLAARRWGALLAGLAYIFSTGSLFFERLALADPVSASAVLVALYLAYRLSRRANAGDAVLTGIALFIAVGAKATALPFLGIPIAAALTLRPRGRTWRANARWMGIALIMGLGMLAVLVLGLWLRHYALFGFIEQYNAEATRPIITRTLMNIEEFAGWLSTYTGLLVFILLLIALIGLMLRKQFYLVLCLIAPALAFWVNDRQYTRYYAALAVIVLLTGAVFLAQLVQRRGRWLPMVALIGVLMWGAVQWLPFALDSYSDPATLNLYSEDYAEYVASDASGFAVSEVRDLLKADQPSEVIGVLANCEALRYLALGEFDVNCPPLNPNGQDILALSALMASSRRVGVYVVYEALSYAPTSVPGTLLATIPRPGGQSPLSVYDLTPNPSP